MDARVSERRTVVAMLTSEAALVRFARAILEPGCKVLSLAPIAAGQAPACDRTDVVVAEFDAVDPDALAAVGRAYPGAAVIALCPARREADCIAALDLDADYLARPFSAADLAARVRVAEGKRFAAMGVPRFYRHGPLAFDLIRRTLSIDGRAITLAPSERDLFAHLAGRAGVVVAYERLLERAGLSGSPRGRQALRSCVLRIRRKIEREPFRPEILLAEIGVGYRLAPPTVGSFHRARDSLPNDPQ